jgi:leader peptidase (prepilin peptidase)/N-methyltransferase
MYCLLAFDMTILLVKGFLFTLILIVASYYDIKTRTIPDWIHIFVLLIGVIDFNIVQSLGGFLLAPLPFLIVALIDEGGIGGGDVKLIGTCGFTWGFTSCLYMAMLGVLFAIIFTMLYYFKSIDKKELSFPYIPFLLIGWLVIGLS